MDKYIIYVITDILMSFIMIYCIGKMSKKEFKINLKLFALLLSTSIVNIAVNLYVTVLIKLLTAFLVSVFINKNVFKIKVKEALAYTSVYLIITYTLELLLSLILVFTKLDTLLVLNNSIYVKVGLSLIHSFLTLLIFQIKPLIKFLNKINKIPAENIIMFLVGLVLILNFITIYRCLPVTKANFIMIILSIILIVVMFLKSIINDKYNISLLKEKNENLKSSYKAYNETIEQCREFQHNIKNELYSLKTILPKETQIVINKMILKYNKNYSWINKIYDLPEGLQGLFYLKKQEAEKQGVNILINCEIDLSVKNKDYIDLCETLGILIDNAIEASLKAKSKFIDIYLKDDNNYLIITIKNVFNGSVDCNKIGTKNYSTKTYKSGIGLNYINNLKNNHINVSFIINNNIFTTIIKYINK